MAASPFRTPPGNPAMQPIAPGDVITAELLNAMRVRIEHLETLVQNPLAAVLAGLRREEFIQCRIKGVRFSGDPMTVTRASVGLPSLWTYDIIGIGRAGIDETGIAPVYGRPVVNDEALIHPALVGMVCYFVRSPNDAGSLTGELMLLPGSEVTARRRCGTGTGNLTATGAGAKPIDKVEIPPPPPPPPGPAFNNITGRIAGDGQTASGDGSSVLGGTVTGPGGLIGTPTDPGVGGGGGGKG